MLYNLRRLPGGASPSLREASADFEVCAADDKYANVSRGDSTLQIAARGGVGVPPIVSYVEKKTERGQSGDEGGRKHCPPPPLLIRRNKDKQRG